MKERKRRFRIGKPVDTGDAWEEDWGRRGSSELMRNWIVLFMVLMVGGGAWYLQKLGNEKTGGAPVISPDRSVANDDGEIRREMASAEEVAQKFLRLSEEEARLRWVRNPERVRSKLWKFSREALRELGRIEKMIGHASVGGREVTAFAVALDSGEVRLLEVVEMPEGPRVDWEAYARYGTASWEELWSGKMEEAEVRVFCQPSTEAPEPFSDRKVWTAFRLSSPDLPQVVLGFARVGSEEEAQMKQVILKSPKYRQRFILKVKRHEGEEEPVFEITELVAVGWIEGADG